MMHAVNKTERLNLLLGNNNCTCVNIDCHGSLNVAVSNPDSSQADILCPVFTLDPKHCYSPHKCARFTVTPFFQICKKVQDDSSCTYSMCFGNVTEQLNQTRMDFFLLNKTLCESSPLYTARIFIRSFQINGKRWFDNPIV